MASRRARAPGWNRLARQRLNLGKINEEACCMCGEAVDYTVSGNHRLGATIEHLNPISFGGAEIVPLEELAIAHRKCNSSQGGRISKKQNRMRLVGGTEVPVPPLNQRQAPVPRQALRPRNADLRSRAGDEARPRFFSEPHPDAVHTLGPQWTQWLEKEQGLVLRPWQSEVLGRALEIDAEGKLLWKEIVCSTPRQVGKSYLIRAIATARCHFADRFGEPQEVLHVANNIAAARRTHSRAWRWAEDNDVRVYRAVGDERLIWPDDSIWAISSAKAIWGWTASIALADEAWDIEPYVVESALAPVLVERSQPQLWLFSTANEEATPLMLQHRRKALQGRAMIAEWGAPEGSDHKDPETWRLASPHWTEQRAEMVAEQADTSGFAQQWLNVWPTTEASGIWGEMWPQQPDLERDDLEGLRIAAVEVAGDRSCYGAAVARAEGGHVHVEARVFSEEPDALRWLHTMRPAALIAGATIAHHFQGPWMLHHGNTKATSRATPYLSAAIRMGRVHHNHDPLVQRHMALAVVNSAEGGPTLTARRSKGPIPAAKAVAWACSAAAEDWLGYSTNVAIY